MNEKQIVEEYKNGLSAYKLAPKYNISTSKIYSVLKNNLIQRRNCSENSRKYLVNHGYFDIINSKIKAYFLGFLMADGYNNSDRNVIELSQSEKDKEILEKFNNAISSNKPIRFINSNGIKSYRLEICSKRMSKSLKKLGCIKNKTFKIVFPSYLRNEYVKDFIRGYFDGDGCFSYSFARRNNKFGNSLLSVVSIIGTKNFCLSLSDYLKNKLNISSHIYCRHPENNNNIRDIRITGNNQVIKFMEWIYNKSNLFLSRKHNKFQEFKKELLERS